MCLQLVEIIEHETTRFPAASVVPMRDDQWCARDGGLERVEAYGIEDTRSDVPPILLSANCHVRGRCSNLRPSSAADKSNKSERSEQSADCRLLQRSLGDRKR